MLEACRKTEFLFWSHFLDLVEELADVLPLAVGDLLVVGQVVQLVVFDY